MGKTFLAAIALMLVVEGALPFVFPRIWRDVFRKVLAMTDGQIRFFGLSSMATGLLLLYFLK